MSGEMQLREALAGLEAAVAHAWPIICDGTPAEVAPIREAQKVARAALNKGEGEQSTVLSDEARERLHLIATLLQANHPDAAEDATFLRTVADTPQFGREGEGEQVGEAAHVVAIRLPARTAFELRHVLPLVAEAVKPIDEGGDTVAMIDQAVDAISAALPPELREMVDERKIAEYRMDTVVLQQEAGVRRFESFTPQQIQQVLGSEEALERVAQRLYKIVAPLNGEGVARWDRAAEPAKNAWREEARSLLAAVAGLQLFGEGAGETASGPREWPNGETEPKLLHVCERCGWTLLEENGSGPDQPCEGVCWDEDGIEGQPMVLVSVVPHCASQPSEVPEQEGK